MSSYFIGYMERPKGFKFYDLTLRNIFEIGIATFFEDIEFGGRNKGKDFVFKEELVSIPKPIHTVLPTPIQDKIVIPKEQTQHSQVPMPLKRFTRERRKAILDNLMIFLWDHEENY